MTPSLSSLPPSHSLPHPPRLHLRLAVNQTWTGGEEEEEETDGGEGGGLGAAGTDSVCVYTCLYILWWIYESKHGGRLQMELTRSRLPADLSVCLSDAALNAIENIHFVF